MCVLADESNQFPNRLSCTDDAHRAAAGVIVMRVERDAQEVINRGEQVQGCDEPLVDSAPPFLAGADDAPPLNPTTGQQHTEAVGPMVAAGMAVHAGRPTELADTVYDGLVQQAARC